MLIFNLNNVYCLNKDQKIGQLFIVPVCPTTGEENFHRVRKLIKEKHIGGVIFMGGDSKTQIEWIQLLKNESDTDLWFFQDAECGPGMRLKDISPLPKSLTLGAIDDPRLLKQFGLQVAAECRRVGLDGNFAPVVDVNSDPNNPVIGMRSFGDDPYGVAAKALQVMEGMKEGGILTCAKHFPGHGDTHIDSHFELPVINKTLAQLEKIELIPFQKVINNGVDMVMVGHISLPELDRLPSSLSKVVMTDLLRNKMGFKGLIVTDALNMAALSKYFSLDQTISQSLNNGADLVLTATVDEKEYIKLIELEIPRAIDHLKNTLSEGLLDEKVARIQYYKKKPVIPVPFERNIHAELYRAVITKIGDIPDIQNSIALVQSRPDPDFETYLSKYADVKCFGYDEMERAGLFRTVIINVRKKDLPTQIPPHAIVALFDSPYTLNQLEFSSVIVGYEDVTETKEAVADCLFKKLIPTGKLPVRLKPKAKSSP